MWGCWLLIGIFCDHMILQITKLFRTRNSSNSQFCKRYLKSSSRHITRVRTFVDGKISIEDYRDVISYCTEGNYDVLLTSPYSNLHKQQQKNITIGINVLMIEYSQTKQKIGLRR